jgi:hypothetical protein
MNAKVNAPNPNATQSQKVWLQRIAREEKTHEGFRKRSRVVEKIFRVDPAEIVLVPLYWSVVGVEHVGVYSNQPVPDVRPRNEPQNPLFRSIATCIRRGLAFSIDHPSFDKAMHRSIDDFLAMGLGTLRIKIDSEMSEETLEEPIMGQQQTPQGVQSVQVGSRSEVIEKVGDQTMRWEYVPWARFGWEPCNDMEHCGWTYFRHRMTMLQIKKRFGKTISASKDESDRHGDPSEWKQQTYDIYEIWDKVKKEVVFMAKGEAELIEVREDPLKLIDFWCIPDAMMTNLPSEEMIPQADYDYIEHYDRELNRLQERRMTILEGIKAAGAFDSAIPELKEILELDDNQMLPITNLIARMSAAGGAKEFLWFQPIIEKLQALEVISTQIQLVKSQVDEILGISDIVRGVTAASETATAQEIKGRWVGVRLTRKRETVIYTVKQMMRMMSQILVSHITPNNLSRMTQMEITEEMLGIMQDDMLMQFIIDIESDSTVAKDEAQEKTNFQEMLTSVGQYAMATQGSTSMPASVSSSILQAALKPYAKHDKNLEEAMTDLPQTTEQLQGLNKQLQQKDQQIGQMQEGIDYWQQLATGLQNASTESKSVDNIASAEKKGAEQELTVAKTREIYGKTEDGALQPIKTQAEIAELRARARTQVKAATEEPTEPTNMFKSG